MVLELTDHNLHTAKISCVVCAGVLYEHDDKLYYQTRRKRGKREYVKECFVPLEEIKRWILR